MELKNNKYVAYSVIVVLVALVAFNFEDLTGFAGKKDQPVEITITNLKSGDVLGDRTVARLSLMNSHPNQRIKVYRAELNKPVGYSFKTERCQPQGAASSIEYKCFADLYVSDHELDDGARYYFQALDRRGRPEGEKAQFIFNA
tara:strand:- start:1620 stop:2051 length:432 start_codon:yes stop_codon:yes gene_type:complete